MYSQDIRIYLCFLSTDLRFDRDRAAAEAPKLESTWVLSFLFYHFFHYFISFILYFLSALLGFLFLVLGSSCDSSVFLSQLDLIAYWYRKSVYRIYLGISSIFILVFLACSTCGSNVAAAQQQQQWQRQRLWQRLWQEQQCKLWYWQQQWQQQQIFSFSLA